MTPRDTLPGVVRRRLASRAMREHHATWHLVRAAWMDLDGAVRTRLQNEGWRPPRLAGQPGAGVDFFAMHRAMIAEVDALLAQLRDPAYPRVTGWAPIPWDHADPLWPMPPAWEHGVERAKAQETTDHWRAAVAERYEDDGFLRSIELDALGSEIEQGIHNWMHLHWADRPWYTGAPDQDRDDPRNDFLASTYSSHVHPAFWKLHGWIDDRIGAWERANGRAADLADGWHGPHGHGHQHLAAASAPLLTPELVDAAERFFLDVVGAPR